MSAHYLQNLNPAQLRSVEHPANIPLQILAGPGSGKTKVLTSRIAHLIAHHALPPSSICAVTFTNKAAGEMRARLATLIGEERTSQVRMGTFHALCAAFLRRHARRVGLEGNFTVCDADESKKLVAKLLKPYKEVLAESNLTLKEGTVLSMMSKAKAKGYTAGDALRIWTEWKAPPRAGASKVDPDMFLPEDLKRIVAWIYKEYEKTLRDTNSLDFDDLLLFGVKLFGEHKKVATWCRHVLVDEFQDTNTMQYDLMRHIAAPSRCVTVVGDPDQSIYGWRSAEIQNLAHMQRDFPSTVQIFLEQNYRSTASILAASVAIVSQDKTRIPKTLHTTHPAGPQPVLYSFPMDQIEVSFIAAEIKRLVAYTGGMLGWGDFVVLLRYNSLSRGIENALRKEGIPNRVLAGHRFFERMEIKDLLAYLQLVDNPHFLPAFSRIINVPGRTIGEKTVSELLLRAEELKLSPVEVTERIYDGKVPDIKPPVKRKLGPFVEALRTLRKLANEGTAPSKLIRCLLALVKYEDHLRKTQPDWQSRWDNVLELINFASEVEGGLVDQISASNGLEDEDRGVDDEEEWDNEPEELDWEELEDEGLVEAGKAPAAKAKGKAKETRAINDRDTPLRLFLQASMLSTDTETEKNDDKDSKDKVTIATCHAAKGLEWPVVMIPAVEPGVFPSSRADDIEEERRLLYVACTRAQGLLYLSHSTSRMFLGEVKPAGLSEFVSAVVLQNKHLFTERLPALSRHDRTLLAKVLQRTLPDESEVSRQIAEYKRTAKHPAWGDNAVFAVNKPRPQSSEPWTFPSSFQGALPDRSNLALNLDVATSVTFSTVKDTFAGSVPLQPDRTRQCVMPLSQSHDRVVNAPAIHLPRSYPSAVAGPSGIPSSINGITMKSINITAPTSPATVPLRVRDKPKSTVMPTTPTTLPSSSVTSSSPIVSPGRKNLAPLASVKLAGGKRRLDTCCKGACLTANAQIELKPIGDDNWLGYKL
ncbi:ATP-dependent DNA helicase PcrA [Grifola frondosa]|uniref:DNA 3'-5' helicase n=1 Tax=Grifola frondosa TaxID=5627 RepID=A0A1C7MBM4_GRIFR|nr:ATP-dependent DNA helicase PcrA [Grifola frondosa]